jgi:hypothetical protein
MSFHFGLGKCFVLPLFRTSLFSFQPPPLFPEFARFCVSPTLLSVCLHMCMLLTAFVPLFFSFCRGCKILFAACGGVTYWVVTPDDESKDGGNMTVCWGQNAAIGICCLLVVVVVFSLYRRHPHPLHSGFLLVSYCSSPPPSFLRAPFRQYWTLTFGL